MEKAVIRFKYKGCGEYIDIEVPLNITANEFIYGLNKGLCLGIDTNDISKYYMCCNNPRVLIKGEKTLKELGIRNGSSIDVL